MPIRIYSSENIKLPIYFTTLSSFYEERSVHRPTGFSNEGQLLFVLEGEGLLRFGGEEYRLVPNCAFYLAPGAPHDYFSTAGLRSAWVTYSGDAADAFCDYADNKPFIFIEHTDSKRYASALSQMEEEYFSKRREGVLSAMLYSLIMSFFDEAKESRLGDMDKTLIYLEENFSKRISLNSLAEMNHLSVSAFCKKFKSHFGCTAFEKLTEIRLINANHLLRIHPEEKIRVIAKECGFEDSSYFCKAYKKKYGSSPRKNNKTN